MSLRKAPGGASSQFRPRSISWFATRWTMLLGIAKPMPGAWAPPNSGSRPARVGIPMTRPERSTSAPPELPGLISALVWMAWARVTPLPSETLRLTEDTIPWVTLERSPSGLPIANEMAPARTL